MAFKRISKWMITDAGRTFSYYLAGGISTTTILAHYLPHTLLLDKYQEVIQLYKNGFSVPVSKELENRFQKVLELLEIAPVEKELYKPFHVYGFDVSSAGSSYSKFGCIIGLPINFTYSNPNTIDKSKMKINDESIAWDTEPAQNLLNSLVISENGQLYAIAREIKYRQSPKPILDTFLSVNTVLMIYGISKQLNEKFNFYAKPLGFRLGLYSIVAVFGLGFYAMATDVSQVYYEGQIDKELKEKSEIFIEGGKEYYSKLLERNKALRHLLGKEGERLYSTLGNDNYLFRHKHIPIVQRKSQFEEHTATA